MYRTNAMTVCRMCDSPAVQPVPPVQGFEFYECHHCSFVFCADISEPKVIPMYRSGARGVEAGAPASGWADPSFLDPALTELCADETPLNALDFGAGQSRVPEVLRDQGHRVTAVDILPPVAHEEHPDRLTGDLLDLNLPDESFDLAYSFQVFEHLPEPKPILFELLRLVRRGGLVLIHTDMETPERDRQGFQHWWYVMPPDHCSFYRHRTFARTLAELPYQVFPVNDKTVMIRK